MKFRSVLRAAVVTTVLVGGYAYALSPSPVEGGLYMPPCATEDSVDCYWDASEQGNGLGEDVLN